MEEIENSEETENIMQNIGDWSVCEEQCTYPIDDKNNMAELPSYPMEKREQEAFTEVDLEPNPAINLATKLESALNSHGQSECFDEINSIKMLTSCSKETFEPQIATPVSAGVMFEKSLVGKIQALPICVDGESHVDEIPSDCIEPVQQEVSAEVNVESKLEDVVLAKIESPLNSYEVTSEVVLEETVTSEDTDDVLKLDASDDEELNLYHKSEAESPCSKRHSPSEPSSSGTAGNNSPFSDSENDLPNASISLPIKKRKIEINETASSSCSEDECKIDYANLKPDEIRALIEEARRYGSIKRKCKCPKTKWEDLPIKGPTHPSGKCTIGKGDWSERQSVQCEACSAGICVDRHKQHGRRRRRGLSSHMKLGTKSKAKATIGEDVPIIELSDSEEGDSSSLNTRPTSSNSIVPNMATTSGECIVLSSSEDDEIVCEGIINTDFKNVRLCKQLSDAPEKVGSPDVVVLNASVTTDVSTCIIPGLRATLSSDSLPGVDLPLPQPHPPFTSDLEPWPDCNIDLENWDETYNFLANIGAGGLAPEVSVNAPVEERPSTPEGWSCPICLEPKTGVNEIMSTTCGHVFCGTCIRSAVKLHKKCPTCRKKLTPKQFHKIFL